MMIFLTGAWWIAKLAWFRTGATRWLNAETAKAALIVVIAVIAVLAATMLWRGGAASATARLVSRLHTQTVMVLKKQLERANAATAAAAAERARIEAERSAAVEQVRELEAELARIKSDDTIYTYDERRRLFP